LIAAQTVMALIFCSLCYTESRYNILYDKDAEKTNMNSDAENSKNVVFMTQSPS